jgi:hypothetical protein
MQETTDRADSIAAAAEAAAQQGPLEEYTLDCGVVLGIKPVAPMLVRRAMLTLEDQTPTPPKVHIDHQDRDEINYNDPGYLAAKARFEETQFETASNTLLAVGTWIKHIPEGMTGPDDDAWVEEADFLQVEVQLQCWRCAKSEPVEGKTCSGCTKARYLSWLHLHAITTEAEWVRLMVAVGQRTGISEEEVQAALASFRSGTLGRTDSGLPAAPVGDGNHVPEAAPAPGP